MAGRRRLDPHLDTLIRSASMPGFGAALLEIERHTDAAIVDGIYLVVGCEVIVRVERFQRPCAFWAVDECLEVGAGHDVRCLKITVTVAAKS